MHTCWDRLVRFYRYTFHPTLISPGLHQSNFPQFARVYKIYGIPKMLLTALPLSDLYNTIVLLCRCHHELTFADSIPYRFLHIHMLTRFYGFYHLYPMPLVRSFDDDGIHQTAFQQLFIIDKAFDFYLLLTAFVYTLV